MTTLILPAGRARTPGLATACVHSARPASPSAAGSSRRAPRVISASTKGSWRGGRRGDKRDVASHDPAGDRTQDLRIKSPLLYQLSYRVGRSKPRPGT